jgi:SlyX protein
MDKLAKLEEQLVELQTQVAFQEDTIGELNRALSLQQQDLAALQEQWKLLKSQYSELQQRIPQDAPTTLLDEKPPHY